jgi:hypothetical protein
MKRFALVAMLLCGSAYAQPQQHQVPEVIQPDDTIEVGVGEPKILRFPAAFKDISMAIKGVADIVPEGDRQITVTGLTTGQTTLFVKDEKGTVLYTAMIAVSASTAPGHMVKVYGQKTICDGASLNLARSTMLILCTGTRCGRVNPDLEPAPTGVAISETKQDKDGNSRTVTKEYR